MAERDTVTENSETKGGKRNKVLIWGVVASVVIALACVIAIAVYNYAADSISEQVAQGVSATSTHTAEQTSIADKTAVAESTAAAAITATAVAQTPNAQRMRLLDEIKEVHSWLLSQGEEVQSCANSGYLDMDDYTEKVVGFVVDMVMIEEDAQDGDITFWRTSEIERVLEAAYDLKRAVHFQCGLE